MRRGEERGGGDVGDEGRTGVPVGHRFQKVVEGVGGGGPRGQPEAVG